MRYRRTNIIMATALVMLPGTAHAWGDKGHKIVAAIAWKKMDGPTHQAIKRLVGGSDIAHTRDWFIDAAVWADRFRDAGRTDDRNGIRPNQYEGTKRWHFTDLPLHVAPDFDQWCFHNPPLNGKLASYGAPPEDCSANKIDQFRMELHGGVPKAERVLALKFLIHIMGDIHQPLHSSDNDDQGGNCVMVKPFDGPTASVKLHSYWDTSLVAGIMQSGETEAAAGVRLFGTIPARASAWTNGTTRDWVVESHGVAEQFGYAGPLASVHGCPSNGAPPISLTSDYASNGREQVIQQLQRGGVRLAFVISEALR